MMRDFLHWRATVLFGFGMMMERVICLLGERSLERDQCGQSEQVPSLSVLKFMKITCTCKLYVLFYENRSMS